MRTTLILSILSIITLSIIGLWAAWIMHASFTDDPSRECGAAPCWPAGTQPNYLLTATSTSSDPIAARLESCEDANQSTGGVTNCIQAATEAYHAALDMSYADLMAKLPATQKSILEETQTAWTAYKDKEMLLLREFYAARKGTMYIPMGANDVMTIWKTRAKTLKGYSQVLGIES